MKTPDEEPIEKISKALDIEFEPSEIVQGSKEVKNEIKKIKAEKLDIDFSLARGNIKDLISNGMEALDGIMKVATASDSPRAYEVAALLLKTISDINKDLIVIHEKTENIQKEKITNITNNSIYVGSTTDLQNLINRERAQNKGMIDGDKTE
jgi:ribosomal protein L7Ae-like RNA K-turn-binding protein